MLVYLHQIYQYTMLLLLLLFEHFFVMLQAMASLLYTMFVVGDPLLDCRTTETLLFLWPSSCITSFPRLDNVDARSWSTNIASLWNLWRWSVSWEIFSFTDNVFKTDWWALTSCSSKNHDVSGYGVVLFVKHVVVVVVSAFVSITNLLVLTYYSSLK